MWQSKIINNFSTIDLKVDELLSKYTYTKTGGLADVLAFPRSKKEVKQLILFAKKESVNVTILGNASNVIVKDSGIRGLVLMLTNMKTVMIDEISVEVESGMKLIELAKLVSQKHLTGLEFACGIPGSIGGAIYMNAGAYGGEMKDIVHSVDVLTIEGEFKTYYHDELEFSYRHSIIQKNKDIILSVKLNLQHGIYEEIIKEMERLTILREEKQPLNYPSCGSVFKRPIGHFAGQLIQEAGLQGKRIGGIEVSKKHAGFMVNIDNGTATDYQNLIEFVQDEVYKKFQVKLETEVKFIGD